MNLNKIHIINKILLNCNKIIKKIEDKNILSLLLNKNNMNLKQYFTFLQYKKKYYIQKIYIFFFFFLNFIIC